ncbi:hypothetical protein [Chitinophaga sp. CF418]|uniref:hypothetical protein n=1 Tax=Chitinophaga sp. CF418 TaxID=1855287 RepID=UPI000924050F|nr:hypothetical protein [Chitinophaga sp. CF418]SHN13122.1 hypothetical protein SAMN05216311_105363 [Chitinophaga sp. CF418]
MTRYWTNYDNKGDKLLAFANGTLYKANPKPDEIENIVRDMQMNDFTAPGLFSIPADYIKEVHLQEGNDYIQVFFGQNIEEHLQIKDDATRQEIFDFLKDHLPGASYTVDKYTKFRAAKKPMIALAVITVLFLYTLSLTLVLDAGGEVMAGGRIGGLLAGVAGLGMTKVLLIYGTLIAIAGTTMTRKMMNPPVIHLIRIVR